MKKVISVILVAILAFSALAIAAGAEGGEFQTYYIKYDIQSDHLNIVPLDGYTQYVLPGEDFKFVVTADEGYSKTFTVIEVDGVVVEPDVHGIYTISDINEEHTITLFLSQDDNSSNMFSSLLVLVRNMFKWFYDIIQQWIKGTAK